MEIAVKEAAHRLGVNESRVRQLLVSGDLVGRRVGREWLVDADDVARLQGQERRSGRPLGPKRAWGLLDLLVGGNAAWLSYAERSQVRSYLSHLGEPDAAQWRAILRGRSDLIRAEAHPAALSRLLEVPAVLPAGPSEAANRGLDLVAIDGRVAEVYIEPAQWPAIAQELAIRESERAANLLVRLPQRIWPFGGSDAVPDAVLAADLLESPEPRSARAGELRLAELLERWER